MAGTDLGGLRRLILSSAVRPIPPDEVLTSAGREFLPCNVALPKYVARGLLARVEADEGGREMLAVQSVLRRNPALLEHVRLEAKGGVRLQVAHVARYVVGVVLRVTELAGGTLRTVGEADVAVARAHVAACLAMEVPHPLGLARTVRLLPYDHEFAARARWFARPQQHVLDRMLEQLLEEEPADAWTLDPAERAWVYLRAWTAAIAVDRAWTASTQPTNSQEEQP